MLKLYNFEVSTYCNAKCPSCLRTSLSDTLNLSHLSVDDFEEILFLNHKSFSNKSEAKFCGELGDPMMHPELESLISIAEKFFNRVEIYTNGGLRSHHWISKILSKYKKLFFIFGIDGMTNEINNLYRVNVNTEKAYLNMIEASKYNKAIWHYNIFNHNYFEIDDVISFAKKYNIYLYLRFNNRKPSIVDPKTKNFLIEKIKEKRIDYQI